MYLLDEWVLLSHAVVCFAEKLNKDLTNKQKYEKHQVAKEPGSGQIMFLQDVVEVSSAWGNLQLEDKKKNRNKKDQTQAGAFLKQQDTVMSPVLHIHANLQSCR